MPEYLAPGVYVEETSFRAKSIEGVSTSTTGFVGRTRRGPVFGITDTDTPELLTSFGDFERIYGGFDDIAGSTNYLAHAVRAYFDNGGRRLFVSRVAELPDPGDEPAEAALYKLLRERLPGTTIISIGHRSTLAAFHQRGLKLAPEGERHRVTEVALTPAAS